ncbi:hypothetical protein [Roseivivax sp.]
MTDSFIMLAKRIKILLLRWAVLRVLQRPMPERYPLSGDAVRYHNFYSVWIGQNQENYGLLVQSKISKGFEGITRFSDGQFCRICISNELAADSSLEITHQYKDIRIRYDTLSSYFWGEFTGYAPRIRAWRKSFEYSLGVFQKLEGGRIKILRQMLAYETKHWGDEELILGQGLTVREWLRRLYGSNANRNPKLIYADRELEFILSSLVETQDVIRTGNSYKAAPIGLKTVQEYDKERRKHRQLLFANWALIFVSFGLLAATAMTTLAELSAQPKLK